MLHTFTYINVYIHTGCFNSPNFTELKAAPKQYVNSRASLVAERAKCRGEMLHSLRMVFCSDIVVVETLL